jgi:predicted PurR-regulated permease PerM
MKRIILIIIAVLIFSGIGYMQPTQLTERELLIQLCEKVDYINSGIARIEKTMALNTEKISQLDIRTTINEQNIGSMLERIKELAGTWNWLLGLFATLLLGMFVYLWKGVYGNRKASHKNN